MGTMKGRTGTPAKDKLHTAVDRVNETAEPVREMASQLLSRSGGRDQARGKAGRTADALAKMSDSLERAAESARISGMALRDQGRDAAKALSRGERVLREEKCTGAAVRLVLRSRRKRSILLAVAGGGLLALFLLRRQMKGGG